MVDKTLQVMQTENNPSEQNLHEKACTETASSAKEGPVTMASQEVFEMESQMVGGQIEIQNGGCLEMTSEMIGVNVDSQMQFQMMSEQQLDSMNGEGMTVIMQSQVLDGQLFDIQNGVQHQVIDGQQVMVGNNSGQMQMSMSSTGEYGGQNLQVEGSVIQGTEILYSPTQVIEMTAEGMNGSIIQSQEIAFDSSSHMIEVEGMSRGQGGMMQEMSPGINEQQIQMQEMYVQGMSLQDMSVTMDGMAIEGMSMQGVGIEGMTMEGEKAMEGMTMQEMSMQEIPLEMQSLEIQNQEIAFEGGETQEQQLEMSGMTIQGMTSEMNGGEIQTQEFSMQGKGMVLQSHEIAFMEGGSDQQLEMSTMTIQEMPAVDGEYQIGMSEMTIQEIPLDMAGGETQILEMSIQEMPLEMQSQETILVDSEYQTGMSEMTIQEISLDMAGGETQILEMSMQEMPLEMQSLEVSLVEGGEIQEQQFQMNEMTIQEIPLDNTGGETQILEMSMQEMPLEMQSQEVSFVEGGEIQEQQFEMNEMTIQEIPLDNTGGETQILEMSMQEMPLEMQSQGVSFVERGEIQEQQFEMNEMTIQEVPLDNTGGETQILEMSMQEMPLEMQSQEVSFVEGSEIQEQQFEMNEMTIQEIPLDNTGGETQILEMSMQEMPLEMQSQEVSFVEGGEIQEQQFEMNETTIQEIPLDNTGGETQILEMSMQEMPLEMQSQEVSAVEGGEIQEQQFEMNEMTIQEIPLDNTGGETQILEMSMQEMSLEMQSQEVSFVEGGEIQEQQFEMNEMTIQDIPLDNTGGETQILEISMQEMPLEMQSQEVSFVERGEIQEQQFEMNEMTIQEVPLDNTGGETQILEMSMQEMPLEMQSQEVSFVEGSEIQEQQFEMNETTIQEIPLDNTGGETQILEMSMQEMPLEMQSQEVSAVEGGEIQEQQFEMNEMTIHEIPLDMTGGETKILEMSMQAMPPEMQSQEVSVVEGAEIQERQFEMNEMTIQEVPLDMTGGETQILEMSMKEMPLEMQSQEVSVVEWGEIQEEQFEMDEMTIQEIPLDMTEGETKILEMSMREMPLEVQSQEVSIAEGGEIQKQQFEMSEMSIQEMPLEIQSQEISVLEGGEIEEQQSEMSEMTIQEIPLDMAGGDVPTKEMSMQEMPLEMQNQEISVVEGGEIQEQQFEKSEMTIQEVPLNMAGEGVQTHEMSFHQLPVERQSQEVFFVEGGTTQAEQLESTMQEKPLEEDDARRVTESQKQVQLDNSLIQEEQAPVKQTTEAVSNIGESSWSIEEIGTLEEQEPEQSWSMDVVGTIVDQENGHRWSTEEEGIMTQEMMSKDNSQKVEKSVKKKKHNQAKSEEVQSIDDVASVVDNKKSEAMKSDEVDKKVIDKKTTSDQTEVTQKETCDHNILIDQFLERITKLEKEKEYLEGRYDELRKERETLVISSKDRLQRTEDHHHCCDILKDYSSLIDYITTPRDVSSQDYSRVQGYDFTQTCDVHESVREFSRNSNQLSNDCEYYKSKCDQIKREKERLERAYENEKKQKEEFEREYQTENDEKVYLEERYQEMLENINRFDETIRSLRRDNECLQSKLNEWASSQARTHTLDMGMLTVQRDDDDEDLAEYKKNILALEKENREFRSILDVLSKKNESQESLKNIEFGLARENEFIELKRERVRLEGNIRELKRTNKHQQNRLEEIRRESLTEISKLKDKIRKLEWSLKENEKTLDDKEDEISGLKKRHSEEIYGIEMRLQSQISNTLLVKNQQKDLQSKIERLEEERNRLKEDLRNSSVGSRDRYSGADLEYQDIQMVRQRYEEEKRSKIRLANDMKYLLADITDLKERNHRLQDDFLRERMEIKAMIEKQANEITQEYLTQISKLQRSLIDETKRRQEAEAGRNGLIYSEENHTSFTGVQTDMNSRSGQGNNDFQVQLANEIRRRENLEVENKKLLYKLNEILSADANHKGIDHANFKGATLRGNQTHNVGSSINNQESVKKRQELQSEIDDLQDKLEVSKNEAKKNKELKRKNEDLEEEVTRVTRKRDELLAGQRNLTREVDHLSRTLEDVERRNRKLSEEAERFTRKIQELEDSFLQEKITLTRNYENEKARAVEEVTKAKEACERRLQVQTETTRRLEEKILRLEGQISGSVGTQTGGSLTTLPSDNGATKDRRSRIIHSQDEKLKEEVEHLEAMLKDANKKHADDLKNLEAQKRRMSEEFDRERQSLEKYFEKENRTLKQRLQDVESSIRGDGVGFIGIEGESREHSISNLGRRSPPNIEGTKDLPRFQSRNEIYGKKSKESEFQQKVQEMERRYDEEKRDILNRASREKAKLEDEVREAKEKLTSYRRLLEDEIEDLKRKHRKEIDILNEELLKQRAEFEERLRTAECTVSRGMIGASTIYDNSNHFDQINETRREDGLQDKKSPKAMVGTSGTKRDRYGFQEFDRAFSQEPGNPNDVGARDGKSTKITSQYGFEDDNRVGRGRKTVEDGMGGRAGLENETIVYREETRDYQSQSQNEKRKFMEAIHSLTQEVNALKNEKKEMKNCFKKEMEKLTKVNDVEKKTIRERAERDKDDEVTRVKENYEEKLASERKRLQGNIDEFRRKIALTEKKVRDMEAQQRNERMRYQEQKMNAEKSLIQSQDELKIKLERDYRKMLIDEKQKFEQTIKGLTTQISFLQNQRKEIQDKLHKNDVAANASAKTEQESRSRMVIQMEHEFFERVQREKRPLEDKIKDLQQEINKLRREKSELSDVLEGEKQELENEREKMQAEMKRKLSKAREDMERKANVIGKHMVATPVKSVLVGSETCHHCAQSDVRQYKEQINLVEQRNMTLKTKTERLERELRVIGDRLKTLEVRNKDLETANREEMSYGKDVFRSGSGRYGESDIRGANDLSTGSMISGMRTETRIFQPNLSPRLSLANGSSLSGSGLSYGDILDKVRYTMHTTGGIYDALRGPMASTSGMVSGGFLGGTSSALRHGNPITGGTLNQSTVSSLGIRNIEVSSSLGNVGGNLIAEGVGGASYGREGNHSPSER